MTENASLLTRPDTAPWALRRTRVDGIGMAYVDAGAGDPIVLLHGNPTSSYLWRNVLPHLVAHGRCVVPDLLGMGGSDPIPGSAHDFSDHARALDAFLRSVGARERVVLVLHDWGSVLGFDWARRHPAAVAGIAYMEAIVAPLRSAHFADGGEFLRRVRGPDGERMVLEENAFIEGFVPAAVLRELAAEEMEAYRRPWRQAGERRRPMLTWPRELPLDGAPAHMVAVVEANAGWLERSGAPKLFVNADPGMFLTGEARERCRRWPAQTEVTVRGAHFVQEDSPREIGEAIAAWLPGVRRPVSAR